MSAMVITIIVVVSYLIIGALWALFVVRSEFNARVKARIRSELPVTPEIRRQIFDDAVEGTSLLLLAWPVMVAFSIGEFARWVIRKIVVGE